MCMRCFTIRSRSVCCCAWAAVHLGGLVSGGGSVLPRIIDHTHGTLTTRENENTVISTFMTGSEKWAHDTYKINFELMVSYKHTQNYLQNRT